MCGLPPNDARTKDLTDTSNRVIGATIYEQLLNANSTIKTLQAQLADASTNLINYKTSSTTLNSQLATANTTINNLQTQLTEANTNLSSCKTSSSTFDSNLQLQILQ